MGAFIRQKDLEQDLSELITILDVVKEIAINSFDRSDPHTTRFLRALSTHCKEIVESEKQELSRFYRDHERSVAKKLYWEQYKDDVYAIINR